MRRRVILDLQGSPLLCSFKFAHFITQMIVVCPFFVSRYLSYRSVVFPCRQVVLPQFWLPRRGSTSSKYGCWGSLCFVVIFSAFSLGFSGRVCSVVGASVFAATIYRCGARHSHRCNLPDHIPSSLRSSYYSFPSFSPTISLYYILDDPLFCITKGVALLNTEEGRVNGYQGVRLMDSPTFSTSRSTCLDDLQLPVCIMTSTLLAVYFASSSIANHEHPRMAFISAALGLVH